MRRILLTLAGATCLALCSAVFSPAAASAATTLLFYAPLEPVPVNHAAGSGGVWIALTGNSAKFTLQVQGLLPGAAHPALLYTGASCPTAAAASASNGHRVIGYGTSSLGSPDVALTTSGDTSPSSALAVQRFPTAGAYTYTRTVEVPSSVAADVRGGHAVLAVHGIDENGNRKYDNVLGPTSGSAALPAEATAPALCGTFVAAQMAKSVPAGSADTGGGPAGRTSGSIALIMSGGGALLAAMAVFLAARRRSTAHSAPSAVPIR